ncbi:uncharacterized protein LOC110833590 isoform X2 [Zootermopsis nevadensis]|uniref:Uncharacterized protein n=2 Tax=Zootermopsis nevadensis TaxID=136037 RepID=A0A067R7H4_ZOONE|nr:uncharacterized protein LOC110833590 isoform X2 [Zootermopsis nevadensis]XP_021927546.1 uncharacterized protein LOC110833590 isoform X2 [Zootermopsis nevadensis]XP_021927547.1 uncharacterized protein LOC110833590 isoform X2 [Zootermopsis nevadensis]XP_021927548.1 uncharacterized protein LOC110833590 isoform X2 [Zootermopsis nevadensis]XP_021927549.1 uncharacterized protein LOC110833590 isoform X2 [Zootermopsis nevadensis]KDR15450.1 hypothetical protein L798_09155 [Zootermopsis nevadensis]
MVGLGSQTKPCLRVIAIIACITLVSMFYLLGFGQPMQANPSTLPVFSNEQEKKENSSVPLKEGYLVWSPSCQIPDMDPHHESIRKFLKSAESIVCSKFGPLTYINTPTAAHAENNWTAPYVLKVDPGMVHYYVPNKQRYSCCYADITRAIPNVKDNKMADSTYNINKCVDFEEEVILKPGSEFVLVRCNIHKKDSKVKEIYSNMHATVPAKPQVLAKLAKTQQKNNSQDRNKPSVLFIGLDSISRLNLIRTMPQTVSHLHRNGWIELRGYNKVADNTFPNLMAIITGLSLDQVKKTCWPTRDTELDDCPYIWYEFSKQGYVTAFGEDITKMSTFNYQKTGFINPPTDYYLRPFILAAEKELQSKMRDQLNICLGPTSTTEHLLRYATDIASTFRHSLYFALLWINNLSHNNHNTPAAMDFRFMQFFNELAEIGTLNNTFVIFLSDHGMRFGRIRETFIGWLEERLPFIYVWIPLWYRQQHPEIEKNLVTNRDRLTSPYDIHMTLRDILRQNRESVENTKDLSSINGSAGCPKCTSLFGEVPYDRSCGDAGINPHWCTCNQYQTLSTTGDTVQSVAKFVLSEIQSQLLKTVNRTQILKKCSDLRLNRLVNVRGRVHDQSEHKEYVVMIETLPGGALFEATVRQFIKNNTFQMLGIVSRINAYWSQSICINDPVLKMYCYCVSS